jgi:hypothetical protein
VVSNFHLTTQAKSGKEQERVIKFRGFKAIEQNFDIHK